MEPTVIHTCTFATVGQRHRLPLEDGARGQVFLGGPPGHGVGDVASVATLRPTVWRRGLLGRGGRRMLFLLLSDEVQQVTAGT